MTLLRVNIDVTEDFTCSVASGGLTVNSCVVTTVSVAETAGTLIRSSPFSSSVSAAITCSAMAPVIRRTSTAPAFLASSRAAASAALLAASSSSCFFFLARRSASSSSRASSTTLGNIKWQLIGLNLLYTTGQVIGLRFEPMIEEERLAIPMPQIFKTW